MLKRICALIVTLLLILPYSLSGDLYTTTTSLTQLEQPIIIAVSYVNNIGSVVSLAYDVPIASFFVKALLQSILNAIGLHRLEPGINNLQYYAGVDLEKTAFPKMTQSWDLIKGAMRQSTVDADPMKSIENLKQGMQLASDAFLEEEALLINDARVADKMGLDNMNYSEYGGTVSEENMRNLLETVKMMQHMSNKYSTDKLETIRKGLEEERERFLTIIADLSVKCGAPMSPGYYECLPRIKEYLERVASKVAIDDYYNQMFGENGIYTRILKIRGKLHMGMKLMLEDWRSKKDLYESLEVKRPNIELKSVEVEGLFSIEVRPEKWVGEGDKLLWESDRLFKEALLQRNREFEDDYLYKAIVLMDRAITLKYQAIEAYKTAENIENNWKRKIDEMCSKDLVLNSQLALKYYEEGKKLCSSDNYLEKLKGAKRIKYAQKVDTAGFEKNILLELDGEIKKLERMIKLANMDKVDTSSAEAALEFVKKNRQELARMSPDQVAIEVERITDVIKSAKTDILRRAYYQYKVLENLRKRVLLAKDFLPKEWSTYEYMFDGYRLNVEKGLGNLARAKTTYENLLDSLRSKGKFNKKISLITKTATCNKKSHAEFVLVVENPLPVDVARSIEVAGRTVWVSLGPYEYRNITYTNKTVLAECSIVDSYPVLNGTAYEIMINPRYPIEKIYLPHLGEIIGGSKLVKLDSRGAYVENVEDELVVTVIVGSNGGEPFYPNTADAYTGAGENNSQEPDKSNQSTQNQKDEGKNGVNTGDVTVSDPTILPPYKDMTDIFKSDKQSPTEQAQSEKYMSSEDNISTNSDFNGLSRTDEEEYWDLIRILEQNSDCTFLDVEYLKNNPNKENLKLLRDEIKSLKDTALSKLNSFIVFGYDELADEANRLISENRYCEVLNMSMPNPETASITGLSTAGQYNLIIPIIAVVVVVYLAFSKKKPPENKIIRILKSSE